MSLLVILLVVAVVGALVGTAAVLRMLLRGPRTPEAPSAPARATAPAPRAAAAQEARAPQPAPKHAALPFHIEAVHEAVGPQKEPPFFRPGGDWTFFEAVLPQDAEARFTVGLHLDRRAGAEGRGKALIAVPTREAGRRLVRAFERAFKAPETRPAELSPLEPLTVSARLWEEGMALAADGTFKPGGRWTVTRWTPELEGREGEVFFDFDLEGREGRFAEDPDEGPGRLVEVLRMALRDGRPLERTPATDPTLAASGPTLERVRWVASREARFLGVAPDGRSFLVAERTATGGSVLLAASLDRETAQEVLRVDGALERVAFAGADPGRYALQESSGGVTRLWWFDLGEGEREQLRVPHAGRGLHLKDAAVSPDGRVLVLGGLGEDGRVAFFHRAGRRLVELGAQDKALRFVGWRKAAEGYWAHAVLEPGRAPGARLRHFEINPANAQRLELAPSQWQGAELSPDRTRRWEVQQGALVLTQVEGQERRAARLHPEDAAQAEKSPRPLFEWVSPRYLAFRGRRFAFFDTETLKMSFPLPRDAEAPLAFTPDLAAALVPEADGLVLARVVAPGR